MKRLRKMSVCGLLAALILILTAWIFHIPVGVNQGYIHLGDAAIYLAASLLPRPWAMAAAVVGAGFADLLTAPVWLPATLLIKLLICLPFTRKGTKLFCRRNFLAVFAAGFTTILGYGAAEGLLFGSWAAAAAGMAGNAIQAVASGAVYSLLAMALDRVHMKDICNKILEEPHHG